MSELLGTFVFVFLGQSAVTSYELMGTQDDTIIRQSSIPTAYALALLVSTLVTLSTSGSHLNPAYTFASASYGYISWSIAFIYMAAQYIGSFIAALAVEFTYIEKINHRFHNGMLFGNNRTLRAHGHILSTGKFYTSFPPTEVSMGQLIFSYLLASSIFFLLMSVILESRITKLSHHMKPIYLASSLAVIYVAFSANGGPVLNPAQDFSPRLYITIGLCGSSALNLYGYQYWWLCGILIPHIGALIGFGFLQILDRIDLGDSRNVYSSEVFSYERSELS